MIYVDVSGFIDCRSEHMLRYSLLFLPYVSNKSLKERGLIFCQNYV